MCSCLRGVSRWFTPLACGPGYPELSKSYMDMASKLFTFTLHLQVQHTCHACAMCACDRLHTTQHIVMSPATTKCGHGCP